METNTQCDVFATGADHKHVFASVQPPWALWVAMGGESGKRWQGWVEAAAHSPLVACKLVPAHPLPDSSVPCQACAQALK